MGKMVKRALKAEFLCCFKNMLLLGCITLGGWIFGTVMSIIIPFVDHETYIPLGGICAMAAGLMSTLFVIAALFSAGFDNAVRMGCTRRAYLAAQYMVSLFTVLCVAALAGILMLGEWLVCSDSPIFGIFEFLPWYIAALIPLILLIFGSFIGALFARFGKAAFWIAYAVCFAPMILGDPIGRIVESGDTSTAIGRIIVTVAGWFAAVPMWVWTAVLCLLPVIFLIYAVVSLMRQPINT